MVLHAYLNKTKPKSLRASLNPQTSTNSEWTRSKWGMDNQRELNWFVLPQRLMQLNLCISLTGLPQRQLDHHHLIMMMMMPMTTIAMINRDWHNTIDSAGAETLSSFCDSLQPHSLHFRPYYPGTLYVLKTSHPSTPV